METRFHWKIDKGIAKNVLGYSGWNLWANTSIALNNQGTIILLNMFFSPTVVAARAIANQVNMAANQFVQNFRTAANPQIVKRYAAGDFDGSKRLLLESTKYSYYLMLMLCLPICLVTEPLLELWLNVIPDYTTIFLQLTIITSLFQVFDTSFYTALYAKGQIRENAMISPTLGFLSFPIVYMMFRYGCSPVSLAWVMLVLYALLGLVVKPLLLIKIVGYTWKDIFTVFYSCFRVTIICVPFPVVLYCFREKLFHSITVQFIILILVSALSVCTSVWCIGINQSIRVKILKTIKSKLRIN